jgi:hypothetical protein
MATSLTSTSQMLHSEPIGWESEFSSTISKLNLAESSANAGGNIIGRETQLTQIKTFLHSSLIRVNDHELSDARASNAFALFIAGPPGK